MLAWLKRLFGRQPDHNDLPVLVDALNVEQSTLEELDLAGIELGRQIDRLRAKRIALKHRAAQLRDGGI